MTTEWEVRVANTFEAESAEEAVRLMVAWVVDWAHTAGYRVWNLDTGDSEFIDADDIDFNTPQEDT